MCVYVHTSFVTFFFKKNLHLGQASQTSYFLGVGPGLNAGTTWKTASTSLRMGSSGGSTCTKMILDKV